MLSTAKDIIVVNSRTGYICLHTQICQKGQSQGTKGHTAGDHNDAFLEAESVIKVAPDNSAQLKKQLVCLDHNSDLSDLHLYTNCF